MVHDGIVQPISEAMANDPPVLAAYAQRLAEAYCAEYGFTLDHMVRHEVVRPAKIDGMPLVVTLEDGTEFESPPGLYVEFVTDVTYPA